MANYSVTLSDPRHVWTILDNERRASDPGDDPEVRFYYVDLNTTDYRVAFFEFDLPSLSNPLGNKVNSATLSITQKSGPGRCAYRIYGMLDPNFSRPDTTPSEKNRDFIFGHKTKTFVDVLKNTDFDTNDDLDLTYDVTAVVQECLNVRGSKKVLLCFFPADQMSPPENNSRIFVGTGGMASTQPKLEAEIINARTDQTTIFIAEDGDDGTYQSNADRTSTTSPPLQGDDIRILNWNGDADDPASYLEGYLAFRDVFTYRTVTGAELGISKSRVLTTPHYKENFVDCKMVSGGFSGTVPQSAAEMSALPKVGHIRMSEATEYDYWLLTYEEKKNPRYNILPDYNDVNDTLDSSSGRDLLIEMLGIPDGGGYLVTNKPEMRVHDFRYRPSFVQLNFDPSDPVPPQPAVDILYDVYLNAFLEGSFDWEADSVLATFVDKTVYTVDRHNHVDISEVTGIVGTAAAITGKTVEGKNVKADPTEINFSGTAGACVIYATSGMLIAYIESIPDFPLESPPSGLTLRINWGGGIIYYM